MISVRWRFTATEDIARIVAFIADKNPVAARRIAQELYVAGSSLSIFPYRGRPGRVPGTRELLAVSPYIIVYRIDSDDSLTILRVWHGAQDRP